MRPHEARRSPQAGPRAQILDHDERADDREEYHQEEAGQQQQQQPGEDQYRREDARQQEPRGREATQDLQQRGIVVAVLVHGDDAVDDAGEEDEAEGRAGDAYCRAREPHDGAERVGILGDVLGGLGGERDDEVDGGEHDDGRDYDPAEAAPVGTQRGA
jgi:hypothetical protein